MQSRRLCLLLLCCGVTLSVRAENAPPSSSAVPHWDARGTGRLPWQGISCVDASPDGRRIVVGTIAPPGDPNVIVLDDAGKLVRHYAVGQRWINEVALAADGETAWALCSTATGRSSDFPTIYRCAADVSPVSGALGEPGYPETIFQYGAHSNHLGIHLQATRTGSAAIYGKRMQWLSPDAVEPRAELSLPTLANSVAVSFAVTPNGTAVVGRTANRDAANLFLLEPGAKQPTWSRPASNQIDQVSPPEPGEYGRPTLPDGRREDLPQHDDLVPAPLSVAIHEKSPDQKLVAAADYPAWQRWVRSSATRREQHYGVRFMPARPAITIYDGRGTELRRFQPEQFAEPFWSDLTFLANGRYLLVSPHQWTSRGLGGQPVLPVDDAAQSIYRLDIEHGTVKQIVLPDAVSGIATTDAGLVIAACWNGQAYFLTGKEWDTERLPPGIETGGPCLVRASRDGQRIVLAGSGGVVRILDVMGREFAQTNLNEIVPRTPPSNAAKPKAEAIGEGVWQLPGGRFESDLGGQRAVETPEGLILIEGHAGLSFDREWAALEGAGLDPRRVKFVLATHEHGDHAPGAYLWRVATGAKFICSREMAYTLQHHVPLCTGYGFHPPIPTDVIIDEDQDLDLAGLKVRAVRLSGHTFGSMGWMFTSGGKKYVAIGDLIMPDGPLGYAGSINFSATDVLASLRKLDSLKVDAVLPGHGPWGDPARYIAAGINVGRHLGWGKIVPEEPEPYWGISQQNVIVTAWNLDAASADFGDLDGDGRPDVAIVSPHETGATVRIFLNHDGRFAGAADHEMLIEGIGSPIKVRLRKINDDPRADILVTGAESAVLFVSQDRFPQFARSKIDVGELNQLRMIDVDGDGAAEMLIDRRFGTFEVARRKEDGTVQHQVWQPEIKGPYADVQAVDFNADGRLDLVTSNGQIFLRGEDGKFALTPSQTLTPAQPDDWTFLVVGNFDGKQGPDVVLLSYGQKQPAAAVYYNRGDKAHPFGEHPDAILDFAEAKQTYQRPLLRDAPVVADWNGDGVDDLIVGKGQHDRILILFGGADGLDISRSQAIDTDFRLHYETGLHVADFNHDGLPDLAAFGHTKVGGSVGPPAVYLWLQPARSK